MPEAANGPLLASIDFETVIGGTTGDFVQACALFAFFRDRKCPKVLRGFLVRNTS